ncbi:ABC transporter ATP-binding protein [Rubrimonas sp.]|uniref:ABC transporter ATP-binding protein n=1 Tax=Rubrimonas sp. TaxID=2036015 RepID=UPI002FDE418C
MIAQIELERIEKHYGAFHALKDVTLSIPKGQFVALVGPSGCGKSTLLRSIAGLETITSGVMRIAGVEVNRMPPRKRDLAMVFQSYALYPHMTVLDNLTYALRLRGVPRTDRSARAAEVARVIGLEALLGRYPRELSGGQRQRVAMGRAIIREPKAFLFDEPLSNLDAALRVQMRREVRNLHDRIGATSVYVTHDQVEAMTMADHVVVMRQGVIEQQGPPLTLYDSPANIFVAGFIGSPAMNFVPAVARGDGMVELALPGSPVLPLRRDVAPGRPVIVGLRPEHLELGGETGAGAIDMVVGAVETTGSVTFLTSSGDPELTLIADGHSRTNRGDRLSVRISPERIHVFDRDTGQLLR